MAKTKSLALSTTLQEVIAVTVCDEITVKEDESVANWPTVGMIVAKPLSTDDQHKLTAGKAYTFRRHKPYNPGDSAGWVGVQSGTTTGLQDEA